MHETPKPGIYPSLDFQTYRSIPAVNNSFLWTLKSRSPAHAKYEREHPSEPTPALLFGQALHGMVLEPATWDERFAVKPECDRRTTAGKLLYQEFLDCKGDRTEVSFDDYEKIVAVRDAVHAQQCRELICSGRAEVSIVWEDRETGILCKGRLDYERNDWHHYITDVKSTEDASEYGFAKSIAGYGYYQAAAFYCDGWQTITGDSSIFTWLAVEKSAPFVTKPWECDSHTIEAGRNSYREALKVYAECVKNNEWPAYGPEVSLINAPDWLLRKEGVGPFNMVS